VFFYFRAFVIRIGLGSLGVLREIQRDPFSGTNRPKNLLVHGSIEFEERVGVLIGPPRKSIPRETKKASPATIMIVAPEVRL
jgi:hypothetical protein